MGYFLATIICPGMFPLAFTILWKKQSVAAAVIAPLLGLASGIAVWLGTAYAYGGELTISTTGPAALSLGGHHVDILLGRLLRHHHLH
ncbi:hypothetical protein VTN96DRAFT_4928 [Rasamsonia emersonii]